MTIYLNYENLILCLAIPTLLLIALLILLMVNKVPKRLKKSEQIPAKEFLKNWDAYRTNDEPGCYVIMTYKTKPGKYKRKSYRQGLGGNVYVGQSLGMYHRVFSHLTGHGNGDVYHDMRDKYYVYVSFVPTSKQKLNDTEKQLIKTLNAQKSYNKTAGGAKKQGRG